MSRLCLLMSGCLVLGAATAGAQPRPGGDGSAGNAAPIARAVTVTSLYRADATWNVQTSIVLALDDADSARWTFSLVQPASLNDGAGFRLNCIDPSAGTLVPLSTPLTVTQKTLMCRYSPRIDFSGEETFAYQVRDDEGNLSQPATIAVQVQHGGLRWEFVANNQTAVESDGASTLSTLPSIIGSTAQDFLVRLDWVVRNPRLPRRSDVRTMVGVDVTRTANAHFRFETGFVMQPQAVLAQPDGEERAPALINQRKFTAGGEFNYNAVLAPDTGGTFVELGALARGNLDAAVEPSTTAQTVGGQAVTLIRQGTGAGTFRAEIGVRAAIKQYTDDPLRTSVERVGVAGGAPPTIRKNSDNLLEFEIGYRRDTALSGLTPIAVRQNRYVVRVIASPEIPSMPGHVKGNIGLEVTGGFNANSPKQVRIIYGMNTSSLGLFR